ncbi:MAG: hypothetical protein A2806_00350 [Candidatus Terrybacteria bacterium RIFCSPHIGHO2_01_FULL_48_17]|uniref:Glycogen debranching enzyme C-terminal domain-containing protein n=1 Tax=Candidatus Terrybacteria bacterium RIFCSPHIGHO2_01_FULL_48_17 TaxID=1802362 RepID=A0A1G2PJV3_9BACT|nr:MAG: hypothetical protein A2806_00350 [Candidatus Terrybacteria bacterium RIFCSPHIGHO2_01_FULL_48_17]OHA53665.1 MAG: hypothetical protein A3A30_00670 [Candidatus Terrybacteria bacterium RIFCSPLOWO2_01_FULL_48_14]
MNEELIKKKLEQHIRALRAPAGYIRAGYPNFPGLFGRDSLIVAWELLAHDPRIAQKTLVKLATLQGKRVNHKSEEEPGKILHEYYEPWQMWVRFVQKSLVTFGWGQPYFGSVDATFLWIIVLERYYAQTHDDALLRRLWSHLLRALSWIKEYADSDGDGFFDYRAHNPIALQHQAWKDSDEFGAITQPIAPVEVQGYAYAALQAAARLTGNRAHTWCVWAQERSRTLQKNFRNAYIMSDYFAYALDGNGAQLPWVTSNPSHLLFAGLISKADEEMIISKVFSADLWTKYGMRTLAVSEPSFAWQSYHRGSVWPHDNWFFWLGLRETKRFREAKKVKEAMCAAFSALNGIIPELYAVDPQTQEISPDIYVGTSSVKHRIGNPQAWASGALLAMLNDDRSS